MPETHFISQFHKPDPRMLIRVDRVETLCVTAAGLAAGAALLARLVPGLSSTTGGYLQLPFSLSLAALAAAAALALAVSESKVARLITRCLGLLVCAAAVAAFFLHITPVLHSAATPATPAGASNHLLASGFASLGIVIVLLRAGKGPAGWISDAALLGTGWVALTTLAGAIFGALRVFGPPMLPTQPLAAAMLLLLLLSAAARRAEHGLFSIFVGRGVGSRIGRGILPFVLLLPLSRELLRARLSRHHIFPEQYAAAGLAATGTVIALGLLLWVSWQFRRLEWEIQSLSLRDELTGIYNLRGFHLLAEQALRMARRSRLPFSVLFVDVDNLKQVNDRLGHAVGSQLLVHAAGFLSANFRETDVLGRIGGDEFAVAGQFSPEAIAQVETRLEALAARGETSDMPPLSLSMGHITADPRKHESLQDLLDRADAAMYERKRLKKLQAV